MDGTDVRRWGSTHLKAAHRVEMSRHRHFASDARPRVLWRQVPNLNQSRHSETNTLKSLNADRCYEDDQQLTLIDRSAEPLTSRLPFKCRHRTASEWPTSVCTDHWLFVRISQTCRNKCFSKCTLKKLFEHECTAFQLWLFCRNFHWLFESHQNASRRSLKNQFN